MPADVVAAVVMVRVDVPEPGTVSGLNTAPAPGGNPITLKLTLLEMPEVPEIVTVKLLPEPAAKVRDTGDAETAKLKTFKIFVALLVMPAETPLMTKLYIPVAVFVAVVTVKTDEPEFVTDGGTNWAETPTGNPVALKLTIPENPFAAPTVTA